MTFKGFGLKTEAWVSELAQQMKMPAAKPGNPSLIPKSHLVEGENQFLQAVL